LLNIIQLLNTHGACSYYMGACAEVGEALLAVGLIKEVQDEGIDADVGLGTQQGVKMSVSWKKMKRAMR
jgi:hypothetical protein